MAWTPSIKSVQRSDDRVVVNVEFSDGVTTFEKTLYFAGNATKEQVWASIKQLKLSVEAGDVLKTDLATTPISLPADSVPTQEDIDRDTWLRKYNKWLKVKQMITAEILTGNEAAVVSLKDSVKTGFKAAYLDFI